ncbi:MAG: hypothetical protein ABI068_18190 [Ktedonobacterales bacterium]
MNNSSTQDTSGSAEACALRLTTETLSAWRDHQLAPQEAERIAYHTPTCRACAERLALFEAVATALRQQPTPTPRPSLWRETHLRLLHETQGTPEMFANPANPEHRAIRSTTDAGARNGQRRTPDWSSPIMSQSQRPTNSPRTTQTHRLTRAGRLWRSLGGAVAAVLVVGLLIGVLVSRHGFLGLGGTTTKMKTPTVSTTATTTPTSTAGPWQVVSTTLGYGDMLAPSNPSVVYLAGAGPANGTKSSPQIVTLQRSDDEGVHWTKLTPPAPNGQVIQPASINVFAVAVSPIQADTVFLTIQAEQAGLCSSSGFASPLHQGQPPVGNKLAAVVLAGLICQMQFVSVNGGVNWHHLTLPAPGVIGRYGVSLPALSDGGFEAQGTRLYSTVTDTVLAASNNGIPGGRLVASDDGGVTWKLVDAPMATQGQAIYDYMPALTGSTIFAVTEPAGVQGPPYTTPTLQLWRSADGGANWVKVGGIPNNADNGMRVTIGSSGQPLLYIDTAGTLKSGASQGANTLEVSGDGGINWTHAPNVSDGVTLSSQPLGVLSNGALVVQFSDNSYRAWKLGDTAWRTVAPAPPSSIGSLQAAQYNFALFSTDSAGHASIWLVADDSTGNTTTQLLARAIIS